MKINRFWWLSAALVLALVLSASGCGGSQSGSSNEVKSILIGTAGQGGTYYFVGQGIANVISKNTDIKASAQATAGGIENARRLATGDMDAALLRTVDLRATFEDGSVKRSDLRAIASGHANVVHVVVRADSKIETMDQLFVEGARIGTGEPGSAIQGDAKDLLAVYGLTLEDIKEAPLSQSEQAKALQDGEIDGAILPAGVPISSVSEVATNVGARILPATDEFLDEMRQYQPDLFPFEIPAGTYSGIDKPVKTFAVPVIFAVRADLPDDTVYETVKAIQQNTKGIARVHPSGAEWTAENAFRGADYFNNELGLKFHPGAIKWYKQQDVWTGESK